MSGRTIRQHYACALWLMQGTLGQLRWMRSRLRKHRTRRATAQAEKAIERLCQALIEDYEQ